MLKRCCGRSNLRQLNREADATSARSRHCNAERLPMNHCSLREREGGQRPAMTRSQETCLLIQSVKPTRMGCRRTQEVFSLGGPLVIRIFRYGRCFLPFMEDRAACADGINKVFV